MAEQDKQTTLAVFLAATDTDDPGDAFLRLEEAGWDISEALKNFNTKQRVVPLPVTSLPPTVSAPPAPSKPEAAAPAGNSYQISINVKLEGQLRDFKVSSSELISDFKEEVSAKFNIPSTHLHLSDWPREVNDDMTLGNIVRPRSGTLNLKAEKKSDEFRTVILKLTYPPDCVKEFEYPVKNTILELKQHVAKMSGIQVKDQKWCNLGFCSDYTSIKNANFKNPIHTLSVNNKNTKCGMPPSPSTATCDMTFPTSLDDQDAFDTAEDVYSDYSGSDPDIDPIIDDTPKDYFKDPMISEHCGSLLEALKSFSDNFEKRYGPTHPIFYHDSLKEVVDKATKGELQDRRPIAVYLHHDRSISSNIFCQKILCSERISEFLTKNYLTWGWDMTIPTNGTCFLDNVNTYFGKDIRKQLDGKDPNKYPLLLIFQKNPNSPLEITAMLTKATEHDDALESLIAGFETHKVAIETFKVAKNVHLQDKQAEQAKHVLYKESIEKDEQAQLKRLNSVEAKSLEDSIQKALKELPEEPEKGDGVTSIRFRFPSGERPDRRFLESDRIGLLYTYAHSQGFPPAHHRLMLNAPKKDLSEFPNDTNLVECGLSRGGIMIRVEELI